MINNCGLYVHIPFCLSKCVYCDFVSYTGRENLFEPYVGALIKEIKHRAPRFSDRVFDTVYFGGGTPTLLPSALTADIMSAIKDNFAVAADAEITTEANPATIDGKKAEVYLNAGFNRVSVGMQSADDKTLAFLGRAHNARQFEETVKTLKTAGFDNINADFMLGLPGQTQAAVGETVDYLDRLGVRHISAYSLILEKGTPLYSDVKKGKTVLPDDDFTVDLYDAFFSAALRAGFGRYEVSNFAKKGYECRHNLGYWDRKQYLGLGLGASSLVEEQRFHNTSDMRKYMEIFGDPDLSRSLCAGAGRPGPAAEHRRHRARPGLLPHLPGGGGPGGGPPGSGSGGPLGGAVPCQRRPGTAVSASHVSPG